LVSVKRFSSMPGLRKYGRQRQRNDSLDRGILPKIANTRP